MEYLSALGFNLVGITVYVNECSLKLLISTPVLVLIITSTWRWLEPIVLPSVNDRFILIKQGVK